MQNPKNDEASENLILSSLPPTEYEWLQPKLEKVELQQGDFLYRVREPIRAVYFPTACLLSWTISSEMGEIVEVGITGNEGMAGEVLLLNEDITPWQVEVQITGKAFKLSTKDFDKALDRSPTLRQKIAAFTYLKMVQLCQSALCNRFHNVEERLCRWLLVAQDRSKTSDIPLTREILAHMIGAGRPTVSLVIGTLQSKGLIQASRGKITILNREGMKEAACECHQIVKQELDRYLTKKIKT